MCDKMIRVTANNNKKEQEREQEQEKLDRIRELKKTIGGNMGVRKLNMRASLHPNIQKKRKYSITNTKRRVPMLFQSDKLCQQFNNTKLEEKEKEEMYGNDDDNSNDGDDDDDNNNNDNDERKKKIEINAQNLMNDINRLVLAVGATENAMGKIVKSVNYAKNYSMTSMDDVTQNIQSFIYNTKLIYILLNANKAIVDNISLSLAIDNDEI